jgi:hypothetical protein
MSALTTGRTRAEARLSRASSAGREQLSPGFGGCAFIKVASEFDDPEGPVRRAVSAHRSWFAGIVRTAFADAGHVRPDDPTRHFVMLRDGAMVAGYLDGSEHAAATFVRGVEGLLRYIDRG